MNNTTNTSYDYLSEPVVEDGILNEQGVMNVALSFFDLTRDIDEDENEKEVILFKQTLPLAEVFCASMSDWSFLTDSEEYEEDDVKNDTPVAIDSYTPSKGKFRGKQFDDDGVAKYHVYTMFKNFIFGYELPEHFLKVRYINGDPKIGYAIKGDKIYCNEFGCVLDYVSDDLKNLPTDFGYMVAYKCAIEMAQHIDPEGTALTRASALFSQTFGVLKQRDDTSFRLQNPVQNHYVDQATSYWNNGGYRK